MSKRLSIVSDLLELLEILLQNLTWANLAQKAGKVSRRATTTYSETLESVFGFACIFKLNI